MNPDATMGPGKNRAVEPATPDAWDKAYATQGRLWGGTPGPVPELPAGSRVLELGCGNGKLLLSLAGKPYDCIALDFSQHACRLARRTVNNPDVTLLVADARKIPLRSGTVNAVVAHHVAGHLLAEDRSFLINETARVLSGGGWFLFCDFSAEDFRAGKGTEIGERTYRRGTGIITHYFTEEEVRGMSGPFQVRDLTTIRRIMTVGGRIYPRAEIMATFVKP